MNTLFTYDNFGLDGQWGVDEYNDFLCLSKACKERKKARKATKQEKRELKNIERKADIESKRADTKVSLALAGMNSQGQQVNTTGPQQPPAQAGMAGGGGIVTIVIAVLGVAVVGYVIYKNKGKQLSVNGNQ